MEALYAKNKNLINPVFIISSGAILLLVIIGAIIPEKFKNVANSVFHMTTDFFGWFYLMAVFIIVVFLFGLAISKYGTIRLGAEDGRPEFSFLTWISMLFSAGLGVGLVFWGVAEPMSHYFSPPFSDTKPLTTDSARLAMGYSFFHWGISQWSVYAILGLVMAYVQFNKKEICSSQPP